MHSPSDAMLEYIISLAQHFDALDSEQIAMIMLMDLEINEAHDGFEYLRSAIYLFCEEPTQMIMKGLYPAVARRSGRYVSSETVERAIRNAINSAWDMQSEMWRAFFPSGKKPSNGQMIAKIAKYIELWKGCCKVYKQRAREGVLTHERR